MSENSQVELWNLYLNAVAYAGAAIAFIIGLRQYRHAQVYERAQVMLNLIDAFENDEKIDAACQMLDWDEREVCFGPNRNCNFKNEMLLSALRVPEMDEGFTKDESEIRDSFDALFDYFHKVHSFWRSGILSYRELRYFFYWFEMITHIGEYKKLPELQGVIDNYIYKYQFGGIAELLVEYAKQPTERLNIFSKSPDEPKRGA